MSRGGASAGSKMIYGNIIVIKRGGGDGARYPLAKKSCKFGRSVNCDIRIQLPNVAHEHCELHIDDDGQILMTTLSTLHPVKLNCQSVSDTQKLRHGDQITIADRTFRFEASIHSIYEGNNQACSNSNSDIEDESQSSVGEMSSSLVSNSKQVSFGPQLSPEVFDKSLPPRTPLKKDATPHGFSCATPLSLLKSMSLPMPLQERSDFQEDNDSDLTPTKNGRLMPSATIEESIPGSVVCPVPLFKRARRSLRSCSFDKNPLCSLMIKNCSSVTTSSSPALLPPFIIASTECPHEESVMPSKSLQVQDAPMLFGLAGVTACNVCGSSGCTSDGSLASSAAAVSTPLPVVSVDLGSSDDQLLLTNCIGNIPGSSTALISNLSSMTNVYGGSIDSIPIHSDGSFMTEQPARSADSYQSESIRDQFLLGDIREEICSTVTCSHAKSDMEGGLHYKPPCATGSVENKPAILASGHSEKCSPKTTVSSSQSVQQGDHTSPDPHVVDLVETTSVRRSSRRKSSSAVKSIPTDRPDKRSASNSVHLCSRAKQDTDIATSHLHVVAIAEGTPVRGTLRRMSSAAARKMFKNSPDLRSTANSHSPKLIIPAMQEVDTTTFHSPVVSLSGGTSVRRSSRIKSPIPQKTVHVPDSALKTRMQIAHLANGSDPCAKVPVCCTGSDLSPLDTQSTSIDKMSPISETSPLCSAGMHSTYFTEIVTIQKVNFTDVPISSNTDCSSTLLLLGKNSSKMCPSEIIGVGEKLVTLNGNAGTNHVPLDVSDEICTCSAGSMFNKPSFNVIFPADSSAQDADNRLCVPCTVAGEYYLNETDCPALSSFSAVCTDVEAVQQSSALAEKHGVMLANLETASYGAGFKVNVMSSVPQNEIGYCMDANISKIRDSSFIDGDERLHMPSKVCADILLMQNVNQVEQSASVDNCLEESDMKRVAVNDCASTLNEGLSSAVEKAIDIRSNVGTDSECVRIPNQLTVEGRFDSFNRRSSQGSNNATVFVSPTSAKGLADGRCTVTLDVDGTSENNKLFLSSCNLAEEDVHIAIGEQVQSHGIGDSIKGEISDAESSVDATSFLKSNHSNILSCVGVQEAISWPEDASCALGEQRNAPVLYPIAAATSEVQIVVNEKNSTSVTVNCSLETEEIFSCSECLSQTRLENSELGQQGGRRSNETSFAVTTGCPIVERVSSSDSNLSLFADCTPSIEINSTEDTVSSIQGYNHLTGDITRSVDFAETASSGCDETFIAVDVCNGQILGSNALQTPTYPTEPMICTFISKSLPLCVEQSDNRMVKSRVVKLFPEEADGSASSLGDSPRVGVQSINEMDRQYLEPVLSDSVDPASFTGVVCAATSLGPSTGPCKTPRGNLSRSRHMSSVSMSARSTRSKCAKTTPSAAKLAGDSDTLIAARIHSVEPPRRARPRCAIEGRRSSTTIDSLPSMKSFTPRVCKSGSRLPSLDVAHCVEVGKGDRRRYDLRVSTSKCPARSPKEKRLSCPPGLGPGATGSGKCCGHKCFDSRLSVTMLDGWRKSCGRPSEAMRLRGAEFLSGISKVDSEEGNALLCAPHFTTANKKIDDDVEASDDVSVNVNEDVYSQLSAAPKSCLLEGTFALRKRSASKLLGDTSLDVKKQTNSGMRRQTPNSTTKGGRRSRATSLSAVSSLFPCSRSDEAAANILTKSEKSALASVAKMLSPALNAVIPGVALKKLVALRAIHGKHVKPCLSELPFDKDEEAIQMHEFNSAMLHVPAYASVCNECTSDTNSRASVFFSKADSMRTVIGSTVASPSIVQYAFANITDTATVTPCPAENEMVAPMVICTEVAPDGQTTLVNPEITESKTFLSKAASDQCPVFNPSAFNDDDTQFVLPHLTDSDDAVSVLFTPEGSVTAGPCSASASCSKTLTYDAQHPMVSVPHALSSQFAGCDATTLEGRSPTNMPCAVSITQTHTTSSATMPEDVNTKKSFAIPSPRTGFGTASMDPMSTVADDVCGQTPGSARLRASARTATTSFRRGWVSDRKLRSRVSKEGGAVGGVTTQAQLHGYRKKGVTEKTLSPQRSCKLQAPGPFLYLASADGANSVIGRCSQCTTEGTSNGRQPTARKRVYVKTQQPSMTEVDLLTSVFTSFWPASEVISVSSHDRNENLPDSPDELDNVSVSPFYERVRGEKPSTRKSRSLAGVRGLFHTENSLDDVDLPGPKAMISISHADFDSPSPSGHGHLFKTLMVTNGSLSSTTSFESKQLLASPITTAADSLGKYGLVAVPTTALMSSLPASLPLPQSSERQAEENGTGSRSVLRKVSGAGRVRAGKRKAAVVGPMSCSTVKTRGMIRMESEMVKAVYGSLMTTCSNISRKASDNIKIPRRITERSSEMSAQLVWKQKAKRNVTHRDARDEQLLILSPVNHVVNKGTSGQSKPIDIVRKFTSFWPASEVISVSSHDRNENLPDSPDELDNVSVSPFYERVRGEKPSTRKSRSLAGVRGLFHTENSLDDVDLPGPKAMISISHADFDSPSPSGHGHLFKTLMVTNGSLSSTTSFESKQLLASPITTAADSLGKYGLVAVPTTALTSSLPASLPLPQSSERQAEENGTGSRSVLRKVSGAGRVRAGKRKAAVVGPMSCSTVKTRGMIRMESEMVKAVYGSLMTTCSNISRKASDNIKIPRRITERSSEMSAQLVWKQKAKRNVTHRDARDEQLLILSPVNHVVNKGTSGQSKPIDIVRKFTSFWPASEVISVSSHDRNENLPDSPDELDNVSVSPFYERVRGEKPSTRKSRSLAGVRGLFHTENSLDDVDLPGPKAMISISHADFDSPSPSGHGHLFKTLMVTNGSLSSTTSFESKQLLASPITTAADSLGKCGLVAVPTTALTSSLPASLPLPQSSERQAEENGTSSGSVLPKVSGAGRVRAGKRKAAVVGPMSCSTVKTRGMIRMESEMVKAVYGSLMTTCSNISRKASDNIKIPRQITERSSEMSAQLVWKQKAKRNVTHRDARDEQLLILSPVNHVVNKGTSGQSKPIDIVRKEATTEMVSPSPHDLRENLSDLSDDCRKTSSSPPLTRARSKKVIAQSSCSFLDGHGTSLSEGRDRTGAKGKCFSARLVGIASQPCRITGRPRVSKAPQTSQQSSSISCAMRSTQLSAEGRNTPVGSVPCEGAMVEAAKIEHSSRQPTCKGVLKRRKGKRQKLPVKTVRKTPPSYSPMKTPLKRSGRHVTIVTPAMLRLYDPVVALGWSNKKLAAAVGLSKWQSILRVK